MSRSSLEDICVHNDHEIKGFRRDYSFLSNFHPCPIRGRDHVYPSSENAFQAAKAPRDKQEQFVHVTAAESKKLGRTFNIDRAAWDAAKDNVMLQVLRRKFLPGSDLAAKLVATGNRYLEETNVWKDEYWGVYEGRGQNKLGKLLMQVRGELRDVGF